MALERGGGLRDGRTPASLPIIVKVLPSTTPKGWSPAKTGVSCLDDGRTGYTFATAPARPAIAKIRSQETTGSQAETIRIVRGLINRNSYEYHYSSTARIIGRRGVAAVVLLVYSKNHRNVGGLEGGLGVWGVWVHRLVGFSPHKVAARGCGQQSQPKT